MRKQRKHRGITTLKRRGRFALRFRLKLPDGTRRRFYETTEFEATSANREELEKRVAIMAAEIHAGVFRYEKWFPESSRRRTADAAPALAAPAVMPKGSAPTVADYYPVWAARQRPPDVRPSLVRAYTSHFAHHILPIAEIANTALPDFTVAHLMHLRNVLRAKPAATRRLTRDGDGKRRCLSEKTIRNIIDGTLRALFRDARRIDQIDAAIAPFFDIEWPELGTPEPTPFTEEERDRLLAYYRAKRWKVGGFNDTRPHYSYYALLHALFFTGARPSELAAVRVRNVNLNAGTIRILESIHRGHRGAVKTRTSNRTVRLFVPDDVEILKPCLKLKAQPDDFFFRDVRGGPVEPANFYDAFVDAQRALGISPIRDLYSTKDTYISNALTQGVNLTWLSEQTGVAEATIKKHYGRYMHTQDRDHLELSKIARPALPRLSRTPAGSARSQEKPTGTGGHRPELVALSKGSESLGSSP